MLFKVLYVLFVVCQLLYGSYYIGDVITPRQLMTVVMFFACIIAKGIKIDKYWWLYIVFILCFGMSSAYTGYSALFIRQLVGFFFVSFVAYCSTIIMVKKYESANVIIQTFVFIGIVDSVVTISQFYNISLANTFVSFMHFEGVDERFLNIQAGQDVMHGTAIPGILGAVLNGYFLSFVSIISLFNKENKLALWNLLIWFIIIIGSYYVQERSGFFGGLVLSVFVMVKMLSCSSDKYRAIVSPLLLLISIIILAVILNNLTSSEMRYNSFDMSNRIAIYSKAWDFFMQHPLGGFYLCLNAIEFYPHNLFLNALIFGGWFGGLMIFVILGMQFIEIIPTFFYRIKEQENFALLLFGVAYTVFTINSFVHNLSIVTGDATIWILWGGFVALIDRVRKTAEYQFQKVLY